MNAGQHIDYDALALEALRGVVKACLAQVARTGLLGEHHFYIAFNTQAAGVIMSKRLKEKYPLEMTIVLQHRFWDLVVEDERFEVKLTFDGIPERLVIPFKAVKVFYDPSVPYGLQFEEGDANASPDAAHRTPRKVGGFAQGHITEAGVAAGEGAPNRDPSGEPLRPRRSRGRTRGERPEDSELAGREPSATDAAKSQIKAPVAAPERVERSAKPAIVAVTKSHAGDDEAVRPDGGGAKIFDLSKFRSKK